jgi:hypothetical protein
MTRLEERAAHALNQVLETMFYETADPVEPEEFSGPGHLGSVELKGASGGELRLLLGDGLLSGLARNFYGAGEAGLAEEQLKDVLRELVNMVGGSFVELLGEVPGGLSLGIPEVSAVDAKDGKHDGPGERLALDFEVDGEILGLRLLGLEGVAGD